LVLFL
jgi:hypothetical protein